MGERPFIRKISRRTVIIAGIATVFGIEEASRYFSYTYSPAPLLTPIPEQEVIETNSPVSQAEVFLLRPQRLTEIKQSLDTGSTTYAEALKNLIQQADKLKQEKQNTVIDKKQIPPSGNMHDYMSFSTYYWPDPKSPSGIPYVLQDGQTNPEVHTVSDRDNFFKLTDSVKTLSLAYYFTGNSSYAASAAKRIQDWFVNPDTYMNPNLNYAQIVKGVNKGTPAGTIDLYSIPDIIDALTLLKQANVLTASTDRELFIWFSSYLKWLKESEKGKTAAEYSNNIGTWYDVSVTSLAIYTRQFDIAKQILEQSKQKRIIAAIEPDGKQTYEIQRADSWGYSLFNLNALCQLARLGEIMGVDLWHFQSKDGRSIKKAVEYLIPFALEHNKWPYPQSKLINPASLYPLILQTAAGTDDPHLKEASHKLEPKNYGSDMRLLLLND